MPLELASKLKCGTMRVLIAEDNQNLAELYARFLRPVSSLIICAFSFKEVMAEINRTKFDLVTYDLNYPDITRPQSIHKIREIKISQPDAIVIVITGYYEPEMESLLVEAGADGIIKKTPELNIMDNFIRAIKDVVDSIKFQPSHLKQISTLEKASCRIAEYYNDLEHTRAHA